MSAQKLSEELKNLMLEKEVKAKMLEVEKIGLKPTGEDFEKYCQVRRVKENTSRAIILQIMLDYCDDLLREHKK